MSEYYNAHKRAASFVGGLQGVGRWGTISSTRKTDTGYEVRVTFQPDGNLSGWLPVLTPMVGSGWGLVTPPAVNAQAFVMPDSGYAEHGVVCGLTFSSQMMPPQPKVNGAETPVSEGQFALVHKNGSYLFFDDNDVRLVTSRDLVATVGRDATVTATNSARISAPTITSDADGKGGKSTWTHTGDVHVNGDVFDVHGSIDRLRRAYDGHTHSDSHGDLTGPPTPQDPE